VWSTFAKLFGHVLVVVYGRILRLKVQKNEKKSVGLLELETAVLECFLEKTPLSLLVISIICTFLFYKSIRIECIN
jgi:hypothetical protein